MNATLLGIHESEIPRSDALPTTSVRTLRVSRRQSLVLTLRVVRTDGTPYPLAGTTVRLGVVRNTNDPWGAVLSKVVVTVEEPAVPNEVAITCSADELDLPPGRYLYSVWVETSDGARDPVVLVSPFLVLGSTVP